MLAVWRMRPMPPGISAVETDEKTSLVLTEGRKPTLSRNLLKLYALPMFSNERRGWGTEPLWTLFLPKRLAFGLASDFLLRWLIWCEWEIKKFPIEILDLFPKHCRPYRPEVTERNRPQRKQSQFSALHTFVQNTRQDSQFSPHVRGDTPFPGPFPQSSDGISLFLAKTLTPQAQIYFLP